MDAECIRSAWIGPYFNEFSLTAQPEECGCQLPCRKNVFLLELSTSYQMSADAGKFYRPHRFVLLDCNASMTEASPIPRSVYSFCIRSQRMLYILSEYDT